MILLGKTCSQEFSKYQKHHKCCGVFDTVEMGGIEPPCNKEFEKFLQELVCFKCLKNVSGEQTKSYNLDLLSFEPMRSKIGSEPQFITPKFSYETLENLMSPRLRVIKL